MDWRNNNFDWNKARTFWVTAKEGSFSGAARALGVAQPTVGRQIASLEEELGVALFERVGRGIKLTPTGLELAEHIGAMEEAALRVSRVAAGQSVSLDGVISITAGEAVSAYVLPPVLAKLRSLYPGIQVELVATNTPLNLLGRETDIALRNFLPEDDDLVARTVGVGRAHLYAADTYLSQFGHPDSVEELSRCDFIGFELSDAFMKGLNALGLSLTPKNFPLVTANQLVQWELVKLGLGIGVMMEDIGDVEPGVRRALPSLEPFPVPMWLICHRDLKTSRRVRVVFDMLAEVLCEVYGADANHGSA